MIGILKKIIRAVRPSWQACLDWAALLTEPAPPRGNLVVCVRVDAIGDFVLAVESIRALVAHYRARNCSVVLVANSSWAAWAEDLALADAVWSVDCKKFSRSSAYRYEMLRKILRAGFRTAIQPTFSRVFLAGDALVRATAAPERIGSTGDTSNIHPWLKAWSDGWYTRLVPAQPGQLMELVRNAEFIREIGVTGFRADLPRVLSDFETSTFPLPQGAYAVLFPSASWNGKAWPIGKFIAIAELLMGQGLHVVVAGGDGDAVQAQGLFTAFPGRLTNLIGKTKLAELVPLFHLARVIVTNDSSALHIGAAAGAPVVGILGGGHYGRFAPYVIETGRKGAKLPEIVACIMPCFGCNWQCTYAHADNEPVKCIQDISVDAVWAAIQRAMAPPEIQP